LVVLNARLLLFGFVLLACFLVGVGGGVYFYTNHYRVWSDLAVEAEAFGARQRGVP
jgi:hypothetical protein